MGDRTFVHPVTNEGVRLTFYTDTGGGGIFIEPAAVKRLGLQTIKKTIDNTEYEVAIFPKFRPDASIPEGVQIHESFLLAGSDEKSDGLLGESGFADRVLSLTTSIDNLHSKSHGINHSRYDRTAYANGKTEFVNEILARAGWK